MNSLPKTLTIHINMDDLEFDDDGNAVVSIGTPPPTYSRLQRRIMKLLERHSALSNRGWVSKSTLIRGLGNVTAQELDIALKELEHKGKAERRKRYAVTKPITEWRVRTPAE